MKVRSDFVTNSSSSAFICLRVGRDMEEVFFLANDMTSEQILDKAYDEGLDEVELKGKNMVAAIGECSVEYVGWTLDENDLTKKNLVQLKEEMAKTIKETYGIQLEEKDIQFDYGEISR